MLLAMRVLISWIFSQNTLLFCKTLVNQICCFHFLEDSLNVLCFTNLFSKSILLDFKRTCLGKIGKTDLPLGFSCIFWRPTSFFAAFSVWHFSLPHGRFSYKAYHLITDFFFFLLPSLFILSHAWLHCKTRFSDTWWWWQFDSCQFWITFHMAILTTVVSNIVFIGRALLNHYLQKSFLSARWIFDYRDVMCMGGGSP